MTIAWANLLPSDLDPVLRGLAARGRGMQAWWLDRASTGWPERWRAAWSGDTRPTLAIWPTESGSAAIVVQRNGAADSKGVPDDRSALGLRQCRRGQGTRAGMRLGLVLDQSLFFERVLTLPEMALPRLPALLDQEIACRTPFDPEEVWHGAEVGPAAPGFRTVHHWILRRDHALTRLAALGLDAADVDTVLLRDGDARLRPVIALREGAAPPATRNRGLARLAILAVLTTGLAVAAFDLSESHRAERVAVALAAAQALPDDRADHPLERLMALKSAPGFGVIWAELSRILPDDTYLNEMRFENGGVTLRGLSGNATALVHIVSNAPLFATAALTAGITPNPMEGRDSFTLSFDLRGTKPKTQRPVQAQVTGFGP